jgi:sugar O-acyltransferase (sialic acid O-acetyltransferase NeuD family)
MKIFGIAGAGGFGKEVMPLVIEFCEQQILQGNIYTPYFLKHINDGIDVLGIPTLKETDFLSSTKERYFNVAIRESSLRERISDLYERNGAIPLEICSIHAVKYKPSKIGRGAILGAFSIIEASAEIGNYFHCHMHSYVAHDCIIGDFVTFAPNVCCNGNVIIEDHAYLGCGAIIKDGRPNKPIRIGARAVIGMGAVVTEDVAPDSVVIGVPARPLDSRRK